TRDAGGVAKQVDHDAVAAANKVGPRGAIGHDCCVSIQPGIWGVSRASQAAIQAVVAPAPDRKLCSSDYCVSTPIGRSRELPQNVSPRSASNWKPQESPTTCPCMCP